MTIHGKNAIRFRLENGLPITKIFLSDTFNDDRILELIRRHKIPVQTVKRNSAELAEGNSQGIAAEIDEFQYTALEQLDYASHQTIVMLDGIKDPHNFGAIIRSAEATGCQAIIIRRDRGVPVTATVYRVSTGAIDHIAIVAVTNLVRTIEYLKKKGYWIVGLEADGDIALDDYDPSGPNVLVVGSEGEGLSRLVREHCDHIVSLKMAGKVNSYNASNAAAIALYHLLKK